jgi:flagellar hook-associated protein 2
VTAWDWTCGKPIGIPPQHRTRIMVTSTSSSTAANTASTSQTRTDTTSAAVYAKVESVMKSQSAGVTKLNTALASDQTKLSGLGQLQSALATFQQAAAAMAGQASSATTATTTATTATSTDSASAVPGDVAGNVSQFVAAYNTLNARLQELNDGDLASDPALSQAGSQLSQLLRGSGSLSQAALAKAGIAADSSGKLQIDTGKLNTAIAADPAAVSKLFTNDGKGMADQMAAKVAVLTSASGRIAHETTLATKDLGRLTEKKADLTEALTAQANALVAFYTAQEQSGSSTSGGATTLFDMMA